MKTLIVYDSKYGHTKAIARAMSEAVGGRLAHADEADPEDFRKYDLVMIGSPTHGGWFTQGIKDLLDTSPNLDGIHLAVFDTRTKKSPFGFAAPRLASRLEKDGGELRAPPEGFVVRGVKGPLEDGELERAAEWAKQITI